MAGDLEAVFAVWFLTPELLSGAVLGGFVCGAGFLSPFAGCHTSVNPRSVIFHLPVTAGVRFGTVRFA